METIRDKKRIWELDALRGLFVLCMVIIHAIFDLQYFLDMEIDTPAAYDFIQEYGGILFILISGICATLGTRFLKRGLIVFAAGLLVSAVTFGMVYFDFASSDVIIYWGVLHLLGSAMLLYGLLKKLPTPLLPIAGALMILLGFYLETLRVNTWLLCFIGLQPHGFATGDYFPLFPNLGWFTVGIFLGRMLYPEHQTLFPKIKERALPIRFFSCCGRHSLLLYLVHQPVLYGALLLLDRLVL